MYMQVKYQMQKSVSIRNYNFLLYAVLFRHQVLSVKYYWSTFNVPVQFALGMQVVETFQYFPKYDGDECLVEGAGLHEVECWAAAQVLHDDPQFRALQCHKHVQILARQHRQA